MSDERVIRKTGEGTWDVLVNGAVIGNVRQRGERFGANSERRRTAGADDIDFYAVSLEAAARSLYHSWVRDTRYKAPLITGVPKLRKGDKILFMQDYVEPCSMSEFIDRQRNGEPTETMLAKRGTVGEVLWAGKSKKGPRVAGVMHWRLLVKLPDREKPVFITQENYGSMVKA